MTRGNFSLYLVTDNLQCKQESVEDLIMAAIRGGVSVVQIREKQISSRDYVELAKKIKKILIPFRTPLIINDRIDIALACRADGVHLGQTDISYKDARNILGSNSIIGVSVETIEQAIELEEQNVDYVGVSPIFKTATKSELTSPWGINGLKKLRKHSKHKLIAIGGINKKNISEVLKAGADGIAVVSAICSSSNPEESARELKSLIKLFSGRKESEKRL